MKKELILRDYVDLKKGNAFVLSSENLSVDVNVNFSVDVNDNHRNDKNSRRQRTVLPRQVSIDAAPVGQQAIGTSLDNLRV